MRENKTKQKKRKDSENYFQWINLSELKINSWTNKSQIIQFYIPWNQNHHCKCVFDNVQ